MDNNPRRRTSSFLQYIDTRWIVWGGVMASALILLLLLLSLVTGYGTSKRQLARQFTSIGVGEGVAFEVTYPRYLLLGTDPAALVVGLRMGETAVFTSPLTVTLDTPPSIAISGTVQGRHLFVKGNGSPAEFWLTNTAILALRQRQTISLTHSLSPTPTLLIVDVEAPRTAVWREFIVGTVSDKSPLLLALAAILPIAALILQYVQKQEELERTRREQQLAEDKLLLSGQVEQLRRYLTEANRAGIQRIWVQISQTRSSSLRLQEYDWLEWLVKFSLEGQLSDSEIFGEIAQIWPAEAVGAFLCAETSDKDLYDKIPLAKITNPNLRNRLLQTQQGRLPLQDWPPDSPLPSDAIARSALEKTPLASTLRKNPLLYARAEDELSSLFGLGAFWMGHPLYVQIATATQSQVVVGARGSGRTSLARALCYYEPQYQRHYWIYLSVIATQPIVVSDLRPALAEHLLQYTLNKPTLLHDLPDASLKLLGRLLAQALSPSLVLAKIERAIKRGGWYDHAEDPQQKRWYAVGETQLQLLARCIEADAQLPAAHWPRAYVECLTAFGFHRLHLVLDIAGKHAETYALLNAKLLLWQQAGAQMTIFLPQESLAARQQHDAGRQVLEQAWTAEQLQALLIHRFRKLAQRDLASVFSEEAEVAFVQAVKTPREMFTLWTTILQTVKEWPDPPQILPGHTEQAQQNVVAIMPELPDVRQRQEAQEFIIPQIEQYFSEEELRILCNNFGMNYEDLPGENFSLKVQEMVEYLLRKSHFPELLEALRRQQEKKYAEIAGKVENYFSPEELRVLCYDLGVKYENLPGETFSLKVRGVVDYMVRYGRFSELIELLKKERPSLSW